MFIVLPVGMNYETRRLPIATFALIGLNVIVYLISVLFRLRSGGESDLWALEHLWLIPAYSSWHAYLTAMFMHAGLFHLLGNMLFLFLFGCCVEDLLGRWRFVAFYLLGGLVADWVYIAMIREHFASEIPMGGASGAISACMGMYLLLRANADIEFKYAYFFLFFGANVGEFSLPAWVVITFWFLKDQFFAVLGLIMEIDGGGVAFGAHVGGFLAGMGCVGALRLFGWGREKKARQNKSPLARMRAIPRPTAAPEEVPTVFLFEAELQSGPFTISQVRAMLGQNVVTPEALYWVEGMTEWESVRALVGHPIE